MTRTALAMPQLGETVTEGTIVTWLVDPTDPVIAGQPIVEVSTDKVDTEIPSPATGQLVEIVVRAGETVDVGEVIAYISVDAADADDLPVERLRASPKARALASQRNVDLASVNGTGPGGAVIWRDVEALHVPHTGSAAPSAAPEPPERSSPAPPAAVSTAPTPHRSRVTARVDILTGSIDRSANEHPIAAFVVRAVVDAIRSAAASGSAGMAAVVEPVIGCYDPTTGSSARLPDAASLRLSAISARLAVEAAEDLDATDVSIIDCSRATCSITVERQGSIAITISPRSTVPTLENSGSSPAIAFKDVIPLLITVDADRLTLNDVQLLASRIKTLMETYDWAAEG